MATWWRRQRDRVESVRLIPRRSARLSTRVNLDELVPDPMTYLGQVAYLQLEQFETLSGLVSAAPDLTSKEGLSHAAGVALRKHHGLIAEIRRHGGEPVAVMAPFTEAIDRYQRVCTGQDWPETLLSSYVTSGLLDDFFARLAGGLPTDFAPRIAAVLAEDSGRDVIVEILTGACESDPRLASRLALWGRRLVGDTLIVARSALLASDNRQSDDERIEPVFTELIAAHTRRMDRLGLTA